MLRDIGDGRPDLFGQHVDASRPLAELFDQLEPLRVAEGLGDQGKLLEQGQLG
ncbi:hypothetical protein D3C72_2586090 [compost metagenome]